MVVRWMVMAWEEVKLKVIVIVIVKCFKHVGLYREKTGTDEDDDPIAGEELMTRVV